MVSIKTFQGVLWIHFIIIYTSSNFFWADDKNTKITTKLCSNPPKGDGQTSSPNQVRPSQILEKSIGMSIRHKWIQLIMFIKFCNWIMICNICRVTFIEISQGEFALLARLDIGKVEYMVLRVIWNMVVIYGIQMSSPKA